MKGVSAGVKVGVLTIMTLGGAYGVWKTIGQTNSGESAISLSIKFADASGLPSGSEVKVAGLKVGEISNMEIEGRYAKITVRIRDDVPVFENAIAFKKAPSLLADYYIELDPGGPESVDASGKKHENKQLPSGGEIVNVVEATSPDQLMRRIESTLPKVDSVLLSVRDLSEDVRGLVNGPVASMLGRFDQLVQKEADTVSSILRRTDSTIARIEEITKDIRGVTRDGGKVDNILSNLEDASKEAKTLISSAKNEVEQTGTAIREKLDSLDEVIDPASSVIKKVDNNQGTLGRLVNDSTIADNIEDITEDAKGFLGTLFGMQTYIGLRSEFNVGAALARHYVTLELHTRPDKFYYIELEKGPRGAYPDVTLTYDRSLGQWRQDAVIRDKIRFTFQFAKRFDWFTARYGIKESTGGVGFDVDWFDRRLRLSADIFDATFDRMPRLKLAAAYNFFGWLYVLGGIDEALNPPETLQVAGIPGDIPTQFEEFHYGRDYFFGAMLKFNDLDLAALLTVGGAALSGAVQ